MNSTPTKCVCGQHTITTSSSAMELNQQQQFICTIPQRKAGVFAVDNQDASLKNADAEPCLQHALNAVAYWLDNTVFQRKLAKLVVDYEVAQLPTDDFVDWWSENSPLTNRLQEFFASRQLPTIRLGKDLKTQYAQEFDIYGLFDSEDSHYIYLESVLVKKAIASQESSLAMTFLIFAKVVHELCHWVTHFTMKQEEKKCTPTGYFGEESGEFMEKIMFGGIVSHHSKSAFCPWEVELVIKDKIPGSQEAYYFHVDYMKLFFDKDAVDLCSNFASLKKNAYIVRIQDKMLAVVTKVSTNDELIKGTKGEFENHTTAISLVGAGGMDFIPTRCGMLRLGKKRTLK